MVETHAQFLSVDEFIGFGTPYGVPSLNTPVR